MKTLFLAAMFLVIAGLITVFLLIQLQREPTSDLSAQFYISPDIGSIPATAVPQVAVSPDGARIVFVLAQPGIGTRLWLRPLSSLTAQPLAGTDGAGNPFWSPDSRHIGFFAQGKLKRIDVQGGPAIVICDAPVGEGGSWSASGSIIFTPAQSGPIHIVSAAGGTSKPVTTLRTDLKEELHSYPDFLPDGKHFLYIARGDAPNHHLYVGSIESPESRKPLDGVTRTLYAAPGYVIFNRSATLFAQPFDPDKLIISGTRFPPKTVPSCRSTL